MLPVLRAQHSLAADKLSDPKLVLLFSPNGPVDQNLTSGGETGFTVNPYWSPLSDPEVTARTLFMHHMRHGGRWNDGSNQHTNAGVRAFTHAELGKSLSLDFAIASQLEKMGKKKPVPNFVLSLQGNHDNGPFFKSPGNFADTFQNPFDALNTLFEGMVGNAMPGNANATSLIAQRKSILDSVYRECMNKKDRYLGRHGVEILQNYCDSIRALELSLEPAAMAVSASCPSNPALTTDLENSKSSILEVNN